MKNTNYHTQRMIWYVFPYMYYACYTHPFHQMSIPGLHTHTYRWLYAHSLHIVCMYYTIRNEFQSMCNTLSHCCKHYYVTIIMTIEVSLHVVKSFIPSFRGAYLIAKQLPLDIIANRHSIHIFHEDRRNWNLI